MQQSLPLRQLSVVNVFVNSVDAEVTALSLISFELTRHAL